MNEQPHQPVVRVAAKTDVDQIAAFNVSLIAETESRPVDRDRVHRGVARGIELAGEVQYFVAEIDGRCVGTLMLTREWSDWSNGWIWWLQSVYVDASFRGRGVFRSMLDHVISAGEADPDVIGLRLYVAENNETALASYERTGFSDTGYRIFKLSLSGRSG